MTTENSGAPNGAPNAAAPASTSSAAPAPADTVARARAEMNELRSKTLSDPVAAQRFRDLNNHANGNAPAPKDYLPPSAEARTVNPDAIPREQAEAFYAPASSPDDYKIRGQLAGDQITQDTAPALRETLFALKLPARDGTLIADAVVRHRQEAAKEGTGGSTYISEGDMQPYIEVADRALQPYGGFVEANRLARAYVESVLSPEQLAKFDGELMRDGKISSLAFDPVVIARLAALARARGIKPR
jgi:hypothetical protein